MFKKIYKRKRDGSPTEQETEVEVQDDQLINLDSDSPLPSEDIDSFLRINGCDGGLREFAPVHVGVEDRIRECVSTVLARGAIKLVEGRSRRAIIHHGIIAARTAEEIQDLINGITKNKSCSFLFISWHKSDGGHLHAIHDCSNSNGSCRCFNGIIPRRKNAARNQFDKGHEEYLKNAILYNTKVGRWLCHVKMATAEWSCGVLTNDELAKHQGGSEEGCETGGLLETHNVFGEVLWDGGEPASENTPGSNDLGVHKAVGAVAEQRLFGVKPERSKRINIMENIILSIGAAPFTEYFKSSRWMTHPYMKYQDVKKIETKIAFQNANYKICNMSLWELKMDYNVHELDMDRGSEKYVWSCLDEKKFWNHYISVEESYKILKKLLIWQIYPESFRKDKWFVMDYNWEPKVWEWVKWLINLIDGKTGKQNCLYIESAPNAGKTLFLDCLHDHLKSVGNLKNWNRSNSFAIEELIGCKIAFWNEPNFEESVTPELLKLLGGDRISVNKKYETSASVRQIPVICSGNNYAFPSSYNFSVRIRHCTWKAAPFLESVGKRRLHPLAFEHLFNKCESYNQEEIRYNNHKNM
jgi:hypothetical protein